MVKILVPATLIVAWAGAAFAKNVVLDEGDVRYKISGVNGGVAGGWAGDDPFLVSCTDAYRVILAGSDGELAGSESDDRVTTVRYDDAAGSVTFLCTNASAKLTLRKTYRIDAETACLHKRIELSLGEGRTGQIFLESGVQVPAAWWRGAVIWQPVHHTHAWPFYRTRDIKQETNLAPKNGTRSAVLLYQPRLQKTLAHWRWGGERFEYFFVAGEYPTYGKRAWPRRWQLAASHEPFIGGAGGTVVTEMVYGVSDGTARDWLMGYREGDEYQQLMVRPLQAAPAWVEEAYIEEDFGAWRLERENYHGMLGEVLAKKLHFGHILATQWGAFPYENYIARPELMEEGDVDPRAIARTARTMQAVSPRIKAGIYTHYGSSSTRRDSRLHQLGREQGWLSHDRHGNVWTHRTDYNMEDNRAAVDMTIADPGFRDFLGRRFDELFEHLGIDFVYIDGAAKAGRYAQDWNNLRAPTPSQWQQFYVDLLDIAVARGGTVTMNNALPLGNTSGFSEMPWFPWYQQDWRRVHGRLAVQQSLNAPGRYIMLAGYKWPSPSPQHDATRVHLNLLRLLGLGVGMLDLKPADHKRQLYIQGAPYIQAGYELRRRQMVAAQVEPDWFHDVDLEVEIYAWRLLDGHGLVTAMSHHPDPVTPTIACDTEPLGMRPGRKAFVWQLHMTDPREVDFSVDTMDSPIRRLAEQKLLTCGEELPARFSVEATLTSENPVEFLLTHSPAVITAVDGKPCQYWLPAAYGVTTSGSIAGEQVTVLVDNPKQRADLLIALPHTAAAEPVVRQRRAGETRDAGLAAGYEAVAHEVMVDRHGQRFVELTVRRGQTEIEVQYGDRN